MNGCNRSDRPCSTLLDDLGFDHLSAKEIGATIRWITALDSKQLWQHFTSHFDRATANRR
ncbi:MAG: hypothetical protein H0W76_11015 [Pyrinomonadaceae bacterium]|nr:hypothetical protein [Pyrinomonadaceae bacterium]